VAFTLLGHDRRSINPIIKGDSNVDLKPILESIALLTLGRLWSLTFGQWMIDAPVFRLNFHTCAVLNST
jgi:hypothetical protein